MPKILILAIDDRQDNLFVLKALLKNFMPDATLITALSGQKGLQKSIEDLPDIIILDVKMPGMDGYEVCRRLKAEEKTSHIPIVMLTAVHTDSKSKARGLEGGADAFLTKPIDEIELVAQVRAMLRIKTAEDLLRQEKSTLEDKVKERTKELSESEGRLRSLFTNSPFPFMIHAEDGRVVMINEVWTQITGYSHADIPTIADWTEKAYGEKREGVKEKIASLYRLERRVDEGEYTVRIHDGSTGVWDFSSAPLGEQSDGKRLVVSMAKDITDRKIAEEDRQKIEIKLQQAQKMEAIGTLAGGIAHDFNNILAAILGYAEMARDDCQRDTTVAEDLDKVLEGGNRAKDLVQQILAFSRQDEMERIPLQLVSVVKEAIKMLRPSLPTTIEISQNINSVTGLILADPTQIHQILMNLCTNAFHAMEEAGGRLAISLKEVTLGTEDLVHERNVEAGTFVQLSVSDSGPGIAPAIKKKIFDPYFTTKETGKGTGMGLAIVHGIVKSYGGYISLCSELGEGTAFHVFFL